MSYDVLTPEVARLWNFLPDWRQGFNVRRSYATDITDSRDNTEQRRATRFAPRFSVEYRTVVSGDDFRSANQWLRAWQNKPAVIPDFARWVRLTGSSSGGASTLTVSPLPAWAAAGQRLVLCGDVTEEVLVDSAAGSTITLADPLSNAWATGAVLRPTFFGLFEGQLSSSRLTRGAADISVALSAYPGGEPPLVTGAAWATFNSREVFTQLPDHAGAPSVKYAWPIDDIDFGRGRTAQFRPVDRAERDSESEFNGLNVTITAEVEQFFDRMKGRRGAFYMPTWEQDFELAATAGSGSSSFLASGLGLANDFGAVDYATVETAIAVCLTDGTQLYRLVTGIVASGGNSAVSVSAAWPVALTTLNVARICWMPIWRFASDEMVTSWRTPLKANVRLTFLSVRR